MPAFPRIPALLALAALLLALGAAANWRMPLNHDVSWLLYEAQAVLAGRRLYIDLPEINPPLIVWLNMAPAWLASVFGVAPGTVLRGLVLALAAGSVCWSWRMLTRGGQHGPSGAAWLLGAAFAAGVAPGYDFGQREHLALLACLPYLAGALRRGDGAACGGRELAAAAVLAAVGLALKPHFALLPLLIEGWVAWRRRAWPGPSILLLALCAALYSVAVLLLVPEYLELLRLVAPSYTQYAGPQHWTGFVHSQDALRALLLLAAGVLLQPRLPLNRLLGLAGLAFAVAAIVQQKGWSYHWYPVYGLGWIALAQSTAAILAARQWRGRALAPPLLAGVLLALAVGNLGLARQIGLRHNPFPHRLSPVLYELGGGAVVVMARPARAAFPLLAEPGIVPVSRMPTMGVLITAWQAGDQPLMQLARRAMAEDVRRTPPRLLVVERAPDMPEGFDYVAFFSADPGLAAALRQFRLVRRVGHYEVLVR